MAFILVFDTNFIFFGDIMSKHINPAILFYFMVNPLSLYSIINCGHKVFDAEL